MILTTLATVISDARRAGWTPPPLPHVVVNNPTEPQPRNQTIAETDHASRLEILPTFSEPTEYVLNSDAVYEILIWQQIWRRCGFALRSLNGCGA
jgi:hypothetical protein